MLSSDPDPRIHKFQKECWSCPGPIYQLVLSLYVGSETATAHLPNRMKVTRNQHGHFALILTIGVTEFRYKITFFKD